MPKRSAVHVIVVGSVLASSLLLGAANASAREVSDTRSEPPATLESNDTVERLLAEPGPLEEKKDADKGRVRVGFDVASGVGSGGGASGMFLGARARLGWQFNHRTAAYLQGAVFEWSSSEKVSADGLTSASGAVGFQLTPLFAMTPGDVFEIAAGPSLDRLMTTQSRTAAIYTTTPRSRTTSSGDAVTYFGNYFGMHARVAAHIGGRPSADGGRRVSFTIGSDLHTTFAEGAMLAFLTLGIGADWY